MAGLNMIDNGRRGKRNKMQKANLRIDFTPMVDMNMLLITFFMFCTTLSIPQAMDIVLPTNDPPGDDAGLVPESKTITLILDGEDKVYYYNGIANYKDYTSLKETSYEGLRHVLIEKNTTSVQQIRSLRQEYQNKKMPDSQFKERLATIKKSKDGIIVIIKPTEQSNYQNLVDALDEMQICGVGKYALEDMAEGDRFLVENYKAKGTLVAHAEK